MRSDLDPVEEYAAFSRRDEAGDHVEERRLAGPVRSDDGRHTLGRHVEGDVVVGDQSAESTGEVIDLEPCHGCTAFATTGTGAFGGDRLRKSEPSEAMPPGA